MCRNVNISLLPLPVGEPRAAEDVLSDLRARLARTREIAEDCTKKSTKAGYDAGGMAVTIAPTAGDRPEVRFARSGGTLLYTSITRNNWLGLGVDELLLGW